MKKLSRDSGQALVILAIGLLALIAFVGLAIDGGRLYAERRRAQNAADAIALAGARQLAELITTCAAGDVVNDSRIAVAMVDIAHYNGIDHASPDAHIEAWYVDAEGRQLGHVGWNQGVPGGSTGIKTALTISDTTAFLQIIGRRYLVVSTEAMAMVGPIVEINQDISPIAVSKAVVLEFRSKEEFTVFEDGLFCHTRKAGPCVIPPKDKGITDTTKLSMEAFYGWLNLSHIYNNAYWSGGPLDRAFSKSLGMGGCHYKPDGSVNVPATGLKGWLSRACVYPYPIFAEEVEEKEGDFIYGLSGMRTSALHELATAYRPGDLLYWPIFDKIYTAREMERTFPGQAPPVGWISGGGKTQGGYYHIIGFAAVELTNIDMKGSTKSISGIFRNVVIGTGLLKPGGGVGSSGQGTCHFPTLIGVKLW